MSFAKPFKAYTHPSEGLRVSRRQAVVEPADGLIVPRPTGELGNREHRSERAIAIAASFLREAWFLYGVVKRIGCRVSHRRSFKRCEPDGEIAHWRCRPGIRPGFRAPRRGKTSSSCGRRSVAHGAFAWDDADRYEMGSPTLPAL